MLIDLRFFIERKIREKRRILRNLVNQKRRYVVLTENEICWQKTKGLLLFNFFTI